MNTIQSPEKTGVKAVIFKCTELDKNWVQIINGIDTSNNSICAINNNKDNNDYSNNDNYMFSTYSHVVSYLSMYEVDMRILCVSGNTHNNQVYCAELQDSIKRNDIVVSIHCTKVNDSISTHCTISTREEHYNNDIGGINLLKLYISVMMLIVLYGMSLYDIK